MDDRTVIEAVIETVTEAGVPVDCKNVVCASWPIDEDVDNDGLPDGRRNHTSYFYFGSTQTATGRVSNLVSGASVKRQMS